MVHPGRILLEDFLAPRGISVLHLARDIGVSPRRIYEIVQSERSITPTMALRLAHYFGLSKRFWLDLQARHDVEIQTQVSPKVINLAQYGVWSEKGRSK
jgi:addiction module HigA family antidote